MQKIDFKWQSKLEFYFCSILAIITVSLKPTAYYKHLLHKKKRKRKKPQNKQTSQFKRDNFPG